MNVDNFCNSVTRRLAYAETIAFIVFLSKKEDIVTSTYDAHAHMMFGSHYLLDWWAAVDNRWYLGFEVTTYPPLAHQTLAILAAPIYHLTSLPLLDSMRLGYLAIACVLSLAFPYAVFRFSKLFSSLRAAANAAIVAAAFSGWWTILSVYGQYPTFFAVVLTLFGAVFLHKYLTQPSVSTAAMTVLLTASVPLTHHFSTISILVAAYAVVLVDTTRSVEDLKTNVRLGVPVAVLAILIVVVALRPFVEFLLTSPSQPTIPHGSRVSWFEGDVLSRTQFDYTLWSGGVLLLAIPVTLRTAKRDRSLLALVGFGLLFGLLSLGRTTPLPSLLYGGLAETLTYFRFATWGGLLLLPVIGDGIHRQLPTDVRKPNVGDLVTVSVLIAIVIGTLVTATAGIAPPAEPTAESVEEIGNFMESDKHWRWRYLALGMPTKLGTIGMAAPHARTLDGYYNTGRSPKKLPRLFYSGTAQLSSASSSSVLQYYLQNHRRYHVRFVFSSDRRYADLLRDAGYEVLYEWPHLETRAWHDPDVEPFTDVRVSPVEGHTGYAWGIIPMACLLGTVALRARMLASESNAQSFISDYVAKRQSVQRLQRWNLRPVSLVFMLLVLSAIAAGAGPGLGQDEGATALRPYDGRVVHYSFDENASHIQNHAATGYNGTISGDVQHVPHEDGQAIHFDGVPGQVEVNNSSSLAAGDPISMEFAIKIDRRQKANVLGDYGSYWFWISGNRIRFAVMSGGERIAESSAAIPIGEWTRVVGTYDPETGARIFVDGNLVDTDRTSNESLNQTGDAVTINMGNWKGGFNGSIDEFSLWNRSVSAEEVAALHRTDEQPGFRSPLLKAGLALLLFVVIVGVTVRD